MQTQTDTGVRLARVERENVCGRAEALEKPLRLENTEIRREKLRPQVGGASHLTGHLVVARPGGLWEREDTQPGSRHHHSLARLESQLGRASGLANIQFSSRPAPQ